MQRKQPGMARITSSTLAAAAIVLAFATGTAQAQQARELYSVSHYDIATGHAPSFVTHVESLAAAAQRVGAKGVSWHAYRDGGRISLVFPLVSMATLDDTDRFPRAFRGTAGESAWSEFSTGFQSLPWSMTSEVIERVPTLSYAPAKAVEESVVRVSTTLVAPGRAQEYEAFIRDINALRAQIDYPYRVEIFRPVVGESRRYIAVTFYDSREAFHGANTMGRLVAANPQAQAVWSGFGERNRALSLRNTYSDMNIVRTMSYAPPQ
jgi:hypothetical protein